MHILLVDDDAELCALLTEFLQREGFQVECAHDGNQGLAKASQEGVDLVVLDVTMPGLSGHDVSNEIRRLKPDVPILFTTAHDATERDEQGREGGERILRKPYQLRELVRTLREMMG